MDDTEFIQETVNKIREACLDDKYDPQIIKKKYFEFFEKYPKLFAAAVDTSFNMTHLLDMLHMAQKLKEKEIGVDDADKIIYGKLQEEYITPFLPK